MRIKLSLLYVVSPHFKLHLEQTHIPVSFPVEFVPV